MDVIIFTETWLHDRVLNCLITHPDYKLYRLDRQQKTPSGIVKKGGGICLFVKNGIEVDCENCHTIPNEHLELLHVRIKKGFGRKLDIMGVYKPPK